MFCLVDIKSQIPATLSETNQKVDELMRVGQKDEAVALTREARKEWPNDPNLMSVDKIVGHKNGSMFDRARRLARQILEGVGTGEGAVAGNTAYSGAMDHVGAEPTMAGVMSLPGADAPRAVRAADSRAMITAMAIHDYQKMAQKASALIAADPKDFRSYRARSFAQRKLGNLKEAEADARRAVELEPQDLMSRTALLDALLSLKRPKEAIAEAQKGFDARQGQPRDKAEALLYRARSQAWAMLGEKDLEFKDMTSAAEIEPELFSAASIMSSGSGAGQISLLPENPWAQAGLGALAAAAVLFPLTWSLGWWRRASVRAGT